MSFVRHDDPNQPARLEDVSLNEANPFDGDEMFGQGYEQQVGGVNPGHQRQGDEFAHSELQFQDFEHRGGAPQPGNVIDEQHEIHIPQEDYSHQPEPEKPAYGPPPNAKPWSLDYYKFMFDVDTTQVLHRLLRSLFPFGKSFFDVISPTPDLYGPFWVVTTLVFMTAAVSNFGSYLNYVNNPNHGAVPYDYDFTILSYGAATFYGYWLVFSFAVWGICRYWNVGLKLAEIFCIYGYSLFIFVPISILCVIPIVALQWCLVAITGAESTVFLCWNFFNILKRDHLKKGVPLLLVMAACHLGLALVLKLYFFAYKDWSDIIPTSAPTTGSTSVQPTESGF